EHPAEDPAAEYVHDCELVVPAAFTLDPNTFNIETQVFHGSFGFDPPILHPLTFTLCADHLSAQQIFPFLSFSMIMLLTIATSMSFLIFSGVLIIISF